jgi:hypothetical protein
MTTLPVEHTDAILACAELVGRAGGDEFKVGYEDETKRVEDARWFAQASFQGKLVRVEEQPSGALACEFLARQLLDGGLCTHCRRVVRIRPQGYIEDVYKGPKPCAWHRVGPTWKRGCE